MSSSKTFTRFTEEQVGGAVIVTVFSFLSLACILSVGVRVAYLSIRSFLSNGSFYSKERAFFKTQLGYFAACLLVANACNSLAGLFGIPYLAQRGISQDSVCVVQAFINQFGNVSNAYFTCALALHTFASLVLRKRRSAAFYLVVMVFGWALAGLLASLPFVLSERSGPLYGPTGVACDLRAFYAREHFLLHLLPIFLAALVSAICFALIFLTIRGTLVVKGGVSFQFDPEARSRSHNGEYHRFITGLAKNMVWFPAAYVLLLVPYSVTRLLMLAGYTVAFPAVIFAFGCWYTLGILNVLILYNVFRLLCPAFDRMEWGTQETNSGSSAERALKSESQRQMIETPSAPFISTMAPAVPYPDRAVSVSSYYDYPNRTDAGMRTDAYRGRESFVSGDLIQLAAKKSSPLARTDSNPPVGLPIPPRRLSPPLLMEPAGPTAAEKGKGRMIESMRSSTASDLDIASWLARQNADGSMPRGVSMYQPMGSAVGPSFSPSELPR